MPHPGQISRRGVWHAPNLLLAPILATDVGSSTERGVHPGATPGTRPEPGRPASTAGMGKCAPQMHSRRAPGNEHHPPRLSREHRPSRKRWPTRTAAGRGALHDHPRDLARAGCNPWTRPRDPGNSLYARGMHAARSSAPLYVSSPTRLGRASHACHRLYMHSRYAPRVPVRWFTLLAARSTIPLHTPPVPFVVLHPAAPLPTDYIATYLTHSTSLSGAVRPSVAPSVCLPRTSPRENRPRTLVP